MAVPALGALLALSLQAAAHEPPSLRIPEVPYLPQSGALCGGAAAAMVVRYWGGPALRGEDFSSYLTADGRGIRAADLARAVESHGLRASLFEGDAAALNEHLRAGRPIIALVNLERGGPANHYVVALAWANRRVLIHDPAFGPFRVIPEERWLAAWDSTNRLGLLILPGEPASVREPFTSSADLGPCTPLVAPAIERARWGDLTGAASSLDAAIALCPGAAAPLRERAGVEFKRENWIGAAELAERALDLDRKDTAAAQLAGASRYLAGDVEQALSQWNRAGEPAVDLVTIEGLQRMAYRTVESGLGVPAGAILTPGTLRRASRRIFDLPGVLTASVRYEPRGGRAHVVASIVERPLVAPPLRLLADNAIDAAIRREVGLSFANVSPLGETLGARWRFESGRRGMFAFGRAPSRAGVLTVDGLWEEQSYAVNSKTLRETRRRAAFSVSRWLGADWRGELGVGLDRWSGIGTTASLLAGVERRLAGDHVAAQARIEVFRNLGSGPDFTATSLALRARSSIKPRRFGLRAEVSYDVASENGPRALWSGAGSGRGRGRLLRAHPLLKDGAVASPAFAPRLLRGGLEGEAQVARLGLARLGVVAFADGVGVRNRSWDSFLDWGGGLRLHLPASDATLRLDVATAGTSGRFHVSAGIVESWR